MMGGKCLQPFDIHLPYERQFLRLPRDLFRAMQRVAHDQQRIAPNVDMLSVIKRVVRVGNKTIGYWQYLPTAIVFQEDVHVPPKSIAAKLRTTPRYILRKNS